jgi:hypothetical protein
MLKPGVVTGSDYITLIDAVKSGGYALPAVNVVGTNSMNAVMPDPTSSSSCQTAARRFSPAPACRTGSRPRSSAR